MSKNIVYFDIETQKSAADVGGWDKKRDMKMSVGVIYSTATQAYEIFDEKRVNDLVWFQRLGDTAARDDRVACGRSTSVHGVRSPGIRPARRVS